MLSCSRGLKLGGECVTDLVTVRDGGSPWPVMTTHGSGTLAPMTLVTVVAANEALAPELFAFGDALVSSQWWLDVGADYGLGAADGSVHLTGPAMVPGAISRDGINTYVSQAIQAGPQPNGHTVYLLYLPDGVARTSGCGEHWPFGGQGDSIAVTGRCAHGTAATTLDLLTRSASHEVIEAATDPSVGKGYVFSDAADGCTTPWSVGAPEVGDACEMSRVREAGFLYQRSWSTRAAALGGDPCVPAIAVPYYNVATPRQWYALPAGGTVSVPITGWSTATTDPWQLEVAIAVRQPASAAWGASVSDATLQAGQATTLTVTAPSDVSSGDIAIVWVESLRLDADGGHFTEGDEFHFWPVGVYVP